MKKFIAFLIVAIIAILICLLLLMLGLNNAYNEVVVERDNLTAHVSDLSNALSISHEENNNLRNELVDTSVTISKLREEINKSSRGEPQMVLLGKMTVTAYCPCELCCGKYARSRPEGKVYGASGVQLTDGVSVAAWLPFNTNIMVDGHKYVVQDRTARWVKEKYDGKIIDIFTTDHEKAVKLDKRELEVWLLR